MSRHRVPKCPVTVGGDGLSAQMLDGAGNAESSPPGVEVSRGVLEQGQGCCHYRFNPSSSFSESRTWVKDVGAGDSFGRGPQEAGQKDMRGCVLEGRTVKVYY